MPPPARLLLLLACLVGSAGCVIHPAPAQPAYAPHGWVTCSPEEGGWHSHPVEAPGCPCPCACAAPEPGEVLVAEPHPAPRDPEERLEDWLE